MMPDHPRTACVKKPFGEHVQPLSTHRSTTTLQQPECWFKLVVFFFFFHSNSWYRTEIFIDWMLLQSFTNTYQKQRTLARQTKGSILLSSWRSLLPCGHGARPDPLLEHKDAGATSKRQRLTVKSKLKNSTVMNTSSARTNTARSEGVSTNTFPTTQMQLPERPLVLGICGVEQLEQCQRAGQHGKGLATPGKVMFSITEIKHCSTAKFI